MSVNDVYAVRLLIRVGWGPLREQRERVLAENEQIRAEALQARSEAVEQRVRAEHCQHERTTPASREQ